MWNWKAQRVPVAAALSLSDLRRAWDKVKLVPADNVVSILASDYNSDIVDEVCAPSPTHVLPHWLIFNFLVQLLDCYQINFCGFYASSMLPCSFYAGHSLNQSFLPLQQFSDSRIDPHLLVYILLLSGLLASAAFVNTLALNRLLIFITYVHC